MSKKIKVIIGVLWLILVAAISLFADFPQKGTVTEFVDDAVVITNNKGVVVDTGISLDNMPYIMVLALLALGLVGFVSKKRSMEF